MKIEPKKDVDLLNLTHDSILARDLDDRIVSWNHGAEETYGWTEKEALGKVADELLQTQFPMISRQNSSCRGGGRVNSCIVLEMAPALWS